MNLLQRMRGGERSIATLEDYIQSFVYSGIAYPYAGVSGITQTLTGETTEAAPNSFVSYVTSCFEANSVVYACMMVRQLIFSSIRFRWQRLRDGKPSEMFGGPELKVLDQPWASATTQDLLSRMIQDADLAGNSYWLIVNGELVRLRPDWVDIVVEPRMMPDGRGQIGWELFGYLYNDGGRASGIDPVGLLPDEVAHFCPIPDPLASYRGMSWLTPILREIAADQSMTRFEQRFMDNGATPNMIIKHAPGATEEKIKRFAEVMADRSAGVEAAGKTLHMYPGADATVVGANLRQIDFASVRNGGEARIAAAAGIPPVIAGLTPGLEASTYSNYSQARRRLSDGTAHPLWQNLSGTLQTLLPVPRSIRGDVRLWYDATDVPFLREDESDAANIAATRASTISTFITAGFTADSAIAAVEANDLGLLQHTGLFSVQLQEPGAQDQNTPPTEQPQEQPALVAGNGRAR